MWTFVGVTLSTVWKLIVLGLWGRWIETLYSNSNNMQLRAFALSLAMLYANGNSSFKMYSYSNSKYYGVLFPYFCNFTWLFNEHVTWSWVCCMNTSRALQLFPCGWCCHRLSYGLTAAALNQTRSMECIGDPLSSLESYFAFMRIMNLHFVVWPLGHSWGARELLSPWPHCPSCEESNVCGAHTQIALCPCVWCDSQSLPSKRRNFVINLDWGWQVEVKYLPHIPTTAYHSACSFTFYLGFSET